MSHKKDDTPGLYELSFILHFIQFLVKSICLSKIFWHFALQYIWYVNSSKNVGLVLTFVGCLQLVVYCNDVKPRDSVISDGFNAKCLVGRINEIKIWVEIPFISLPVKTTCSFG